MPPMSEARIVALARLHRIREAFGALYDLIELAIVEEMPWTATGKRLDVDQRTARTWCIAALAALAAL